MSNLHNMGFMWLKSNPLRIGFSFKTWNYVFLISLKTRCVQVFKIKVIESSILFSK